MLVYWMVVYWMVIQQSIGVVVRGGGMTCSGGHWVDDAECNGDGICGAECNGG